MSTSSPIVNRGSKYLSFNEHVSVMIVKQQTFIQAENMKLFYNFEYY
ncbi:hypothetical protein [Psychrobacter sp. DWR1-2-3]